MITREQVADLQPGDVVEIRHNDYPDTFTRGPVRQLATADLFVGNFALRFGREAMAGGLDKFTLTVVSRAPRPLYFNHSRTQPVPGDVVRDADDDGITTTWFTDGQERTLWCALPGLAVWEREDMPTRLRLLVDGETGMPVGPDPAEAWDQVFEAGAEHVANSGLVGIPHDPAHNPYETGQVVQ